MDVARKFKLSPSRIHLVEKRAAADRLMAERRGRLGEMLRSDDDMEKLVAVEDLVDTLGVTVVAKNRLMEHFVKVATKEISLRELMDMCLDEPVEGLENSSCQTPPTEYNQIMEQDRWGFFLRMKM